MNFCFLMHCHYFILSINHGDIGQGAFFATDIWPWNDDKILPKLKNFETCCREKCLCGVISACCMCGFGWKRISIHKLLGSRHFQTDRNNCSTERLVKITKTADFLFEIGRILMSKRPNEFLRCLTTTQQTTSQTANKTLQEWGHQVWLLSKNRSILLDWNWAVCLWESWPDVSFCWSQQTILWLVPLVTWTH